MDVTETRSEGLERELKVVIPAQTLDARLTTYLTDMKDKVQLKGFRPGKVPLSHMRKMYGRSAMAEVINSVMNESVKSAMDERSETPAFQPAVDLDEGRMGDVLAGNEDLAFAIRYEVLPEVTVDGLDAIEVERPVVTVADADVEREVQTLAERNRPFEPAARPAEEGDRVTIDFVGKVDGVPFEGGSAEKVDITLGEGRFIPGFEPQLVGVSAGEARQVTVTFPEQYPAQNLAGKEAVFDVTVHAVAAPGEPSVDDRLAETLGLDSLDALKDAVRGQMESAYARAIRTRVKKALLDKLDERFRFPLPQTLVESEFDTIWKAAEREREQKGESFDETKGPDEEGSEEHARAEYRRMAERRVRLGLVISEVGQSAKVEVTDEEVQRALQERMRQYPGQEREVFEYYRKTPEALASLRAPIFEDKVVEYLLELVNVTDKPVTKDELMAMAAADDDHDHDHDHSHDHDH